MLGTLARALETGQFSLASSAAALKPAASRFSASPESVMRISVIPTPGWKSTSTDVLSEIAGLPVLARPFESAIEKHDACAAAISSSGLVPPSGDSALDTQVMG